MKRSDMLWILAVGTFVLGDLTTTTLGIYLGLVESHPLYHNVSHELLIPIALSVKIVFLAGAFLVWELIPTPARLGIPLGLSVLGTAVTLWNSYLILSVV